MKLYYLVYKVTISSTFDTKLTRQDLSVFSWKCENMRFLNVTVTERVSDDRYSNMHHQSAHGMRYYH